MDDLISRADAIAAVRYGKDPIKNLEALPGVKVEKFTDNRFYNDIISLHSNYYDLKEHIKNEMVHRIARYLQECKAIVFDEDEKYCGLDEMRITATLLVIMPKPPKEGE